ncbi:MAG: hypothetical protein ACJAU2_001276 [Maribacter sp.]|jgi:hypothetical protein
MVTGIKNSIKETPTITISKADSAKDKQCDMVKIVASHKTFAQFLKVKGMAKAERNKI